MNLWPRRTTTTTKKMKISLSLPLLLAGQYMFHETVGEDTTERESPRAAPQCKAMDPDGQCVMEEHHDTTSNQDDWLSLYPPTCGLYMAESSIPNSGWGMYANQNIKQGNEILPLDLVVQVLDLPRQYREGKENWLLAEYVWNSGKCCK